MTDIDLEKKGKKERRMGAALGLVQVVAVLGSRLLIIPIILHYLDSAEFGLYQLIGAFVGYLALIDFGVSGTLGRFIARYQALNDRIGQDNVFSMCLIIYSFLAVLTGIVGVFLYYNLDLIFSRSLSFEEMAQAKVMFIILVWSMCATVLGKALAGVNAGHERFIFSRVVDSICTFGKVAVVAVVLDMGYRAIGIVFVEALINLAILGLNTGYSFIVLKVRLKLHYWDWPLFGELIRFAFWTFLAALVLQINFKLGSVILGIMTTTTMVGVYAIALQINTLYNSLSSAISTVYLPQITRLVVEGASGVQLTKAIVTPSRYQFMIVGCVLCGFIILGKQFISLWAGREYIGAWAAALFIIIPVTIPITQNTILSILYAKLLNRDRALITLAFAIISGVAAIFMVRPFGLYGPALATGMALLIGHGVVMNIYYHRIVGLDMWLFFKQVSDRILPVIIAVLVVGNVINYVPVGHGWVGFMCRGILYLLFYSFSMWLFGMNDHERSFFLNGLRAGLKTLCIAKRETNV